VCVSLTTLIIVAISYAGLHACIHYMSFVSNLTYMVSSHVNDNVKDH